jgi:hypothetical protein
VSEIREQGAEIREQGSGNRTKGRIPAAIPDAGFALKPDY